MAEGFRSELGVPWYYILGHIYQRERLLQKLMVGSNRPDRCIFFSEGDVFGTVLRDPENSWTE